MTILITADAVGGVWTYALDLSRGLASRGVRVVLAVMGAPVSIDQRRAADDVQGLTLVGQPCRQECPEEPSTDVDASGAWLLDLARATSPDVVHVNRFAHAALPFGAPVLVAAHWCVRSWFREVRRTAPPSDWSRYEREVKRGLAAARVIVAPSRAMALSVIRDYAPHAPVIAIHNGRHRAGFAPGKKEPFVLTAGRMRDEAKNVGQLAAVARRIPWPVCLAGDDSELKSALTPLGRLSDAGLAGWFARASVHALPARYAPFGFTALEAALSGCALVLGDIPSLRELWEGAALFVDPDDADALTAALRTLIEDPARRQLMANLARERSAQYTVDAMAEAYLTMYRQLASAPPLPFGGLVARHGAVA
jgi:glycosyltransferase involved in cell wall biosynthesis